MRRAVAFIVLAAPLAAAYRVEYRLSKEQRRIVPSAFELVDCEFAHGLFGLVSPPAYYCVYLVPATKEDAATALSASLSGRGYEVNRAPYFDAVELKGRRADFRVQARLGLRDVGPHLVPGEIPDGYVAASVTVGRPEPR